MLTHVGVVYCSLLLLEKVTGDVRLAAIDVDEMRELVEGAWAMVVPKRVAAEYAATRAD